MRFPEIVGRPIEVRWQPVLKPQHGREVHAGTQIRERRILLESALRRRPALHRRIWVHELFHFVWVRLSNRQRRSFEALIAREMRARAAGELGWSAHWRKQALRASDRVRRTRRWREYVCESFCDTAAWLFSGSRRSVEYTLDACARSPRRRWFVESGLARRISV